MKRAACLALVPICLAACDNSQQPNVVDVQAENIDLTAPTIVIDLGTLGGASSFATDVNDEGVTVGYSLTGGSSSDYHAFRWTPDGGMTDLGTLGGTESMAAALNARGDIVGTSSTSTGERHAVLWPASGGIVDLGTLPNASTAATDINDAGLVVGNVYGDRFTSRVFQWTAEGGLRELDLPGSEIYVAGLNERVDLTGSFCCGQADVFGMYLAVSRDYFRDLGGVTNGSAVGNGLNELKQVVGWDEPRSGIDPPAPYQLAPYFWSEERGFIVLGSLGGTYGYANAINDRGYVVGASAVVPNVCCATHAFVWSSGRGMVDLGGLGGSHHVATSLNERGQVVGFSTPAGTDLVHAVMWRGLGGAPSSAQPTTQVSRVSSFGGALACLNEPQGQASKTRLMECLAGS